MNTHQSNSEENSEKVLCATCIFYQKYLHTLDAICGTLSYAGFREICELWNCRFLALFFMFAYFGCLVIDRESFVQNAASPLLRVRIWLHSSLGPL